MRRRAKGFATCDLLCLNLPYEIPYKLRRFSRPSRSPCVTKGGTIYEPYYLALAVAFAKREGYKAFIIDAVANDMSFGEVLHYVKHLKPRVIVVDTSTPSIHNDVIMAETLQEACPKSRVVLVGRHVTYDAENTLKACSSVKIVARGYFYKQVLDLLEGKELNRIRGISYRDGDKIKHKPDAPLPKGEFPFVSEVYKNQLDLRKYFYASCRYPYLMLNFALGCPFNCAFCLTPDMPVITNKGLHKIGDIVDEFHPEPFEQLKIEKDIRVLDKNGEFKKITHVMKRPYNGDIIKIKVVGLPYELKMTPNHKLLVKILDEKPKWIKAGDLERLIKSVKNNEKVYSFNCKLCGKSTTTTNILVYKKGICGECRVRNNIVVPRNEVYLLIPRIKEVKDIDVIDLAKILKPNGHHKRRFRKYTIKEVLSVLNLSKKGLSTRKIAKIIDMSKNRVYQIIKLGCNKDYLQIRLHYNKTEVWYTRCKKKVKRFIKVDEEFLKLCGYYLSEGHVCIDKNRPNSKIVCWTFGKHEKDIVNEVVKLIENIFDIKPRLSYTNTGIQIYINSTIIADLFLTLFNTKSENKIIPWEWLYLPENKLYALLSGLLIGDGCYKKTSNNNAINFITTSKILAEQVRLILNKLGIPCSYHIGNLNESKIDGRIVKPKHISYNIEVYGIKNIRKLINNCKLPWKLKNIREKSIVRCFYDEKYICVPIIRVSKEKYEGFVYNLTVEDSHSYTIDTIIVKNCNEYNKVSYNPRPIDNMIEELKYVKKELPFVKEILFDDPTFVVDEDLICELCDSMIKADLNITWSCATRANISYDTLKIMKEAGFRLAHIGIESLNQEALNKINKGLRVEQEVEYLERCEKLGVLNHACFIVGLPSDNPKTIEATIEYAKNLPAIDTIQVFPAIPTPGLPFYKWCKENGYLLTEDYARWLKPDGSYNVVISYPWLSREEIEFWIKEFYRRFYFRARMIGYKLKQSITSYEELKRNWMMFKSGIGKI